MGGVRLAAARQVVYDPEGSLGLSAPCRLVSGSTEEGLSGHSSGGPRALLRLLYGTPPYLVLNAVLSVP